MTILMPGLSATATLHPLLLHFPIVLWTVALLFGAIGLVRGIEWAERSGFWLLHLGTAAGMLTVWTGYSAADALGHDSAGHGLVHTHRNLMLAALALAVVSSLIGVAWHLKPGKMLQIAMISMLSATVAVTAFGADRGAEMVWRYGIGAGTEVPPAADGHGHTHGAALPNEADTTKPTHGAPGHHDTEPAAPDHGVFGHHAEPGPSAPDHGAPGDHDAMPPSPPPAHNHGAHAHSPLDTP